MRLHEITKANSKVQEAKNAPGVLPKRLYHGTSAEMARKIIAEGSLTSPSNWGSESIADYYASHFEDEGVDTAIISVPLAAFDKAKLDEDHPSLEEPISRSISGDFISLRSSHVPWIACFARVESVLYHGIVPITVKNVRFSTFAKQEMSKFVFANYERLSYLESVGKLDGADRETLANIRKMHLLPR